MNYHSASGFPTHSVNYILSYDVAAVDGDVGLSDSCMNVRVDLVPAVEVGIRDYDDAGRHVLYNLYWQEARTRESIGSAYMLAGSSQWARGGFYHSRSG